MQRTISVIPTLVLTVAVLLLVGIPARADTVYSTFGPGDSYSGNYASIYENSVSYQAIAAGFTPAADAILDSVELALGFLGVDSSTSVLVQLLADSSGLPDTGTVLESWVLDIGSAGIHSVVSSGNPTLSAGTAYWVAVFSDSGTSARWFLSDQGYTGLAFDGGIGFRTTSLSTPAFRVNGVAVPVPGAAFTGLSLLGALFLLRRRRR